MSGPFRYPDQDSPFRTLGCKNCVLRPRQFGTTFSVVSAKFRRFWKHRFLPKRGATPKHTKMMMGAAPEIYFGLFSETPILTFMLQIWHRQCKKPIFPAVLGVFAHRKKKNRLHNLSNPEAHAIRKEEKCALNNLIFGAPRSRPIFCAPTRITGPGVPPPRNTVKIGISGPGLSAPHYWTRKR